MSAKYILNACEANDSGFLEIPYSPTYPIVWPNTLLLAVRFVLPSALNKASLFVSIFNTLSSQNVIKSVSLTCNFCIDPYIGFISLVMGNACMNWLSSLTPDVELNIPENINPLSFCSSLYSASNVVETTTPLSIKGALKSSFILLDSTPLPKVKALKKLRSTAWPWTWFVSSFITFWPEEFSVLLELKIVVFAVKLYKLFSSVNVNIVPIGLLSLSTEEISVATLLSKLNWSPSSTESTKFTVENIKSRPEKYVVGSENLVIFTCVPLTDFTVVFLGTPTPVINIPSVMLLLKSSVKTTKAPAVWFAVVADITVFIPSPVTFIPGFIIGRELLDS